MDCNETLCTFALARLFASEPLVPRGIINALGDAESIFGMTEEELTKLMGPHNGRKEKIMGARLDRYRAELAQAFDCGAAYIKYCDDAFPEILGECEDAPVGLFIRSSQNAGTLFKGDHISIVGTRNITSYGREWCQRIVDSLAGSSSRPTIVSGLAFGVDITAHIRALDKGLGTIAVMGSGIDHIYPATHERYARRLLETPGCAIISEYPPHSEVYAANFLQRNRIIAGLSRATILIESKLKGGGMTTARLAASYNRDVFAIPGRNDDIYSQGCNYLIHSHIAQPIIGCDEFFKSIGYQLAGGPAKESYQGVEDFYKGSMDDDKIKMCQALFSAIKKERGISVAELGDMLGYEYSRMLSALQRMETDGFINIDLLQRCSIGIPPKKH